jgi:hypothetical protein
MKLLDTAGDNAFPVLTSPPGSRAQPERLELGLSAGPSTQDRFSWLPAVGLSLLFTVLVLTWDPHVRDLAAQTFRTELFERNGFAIWNASWYGGHYTLTYSVLFPPLGALIGPRLVGALAVVASAYLFDRLVRDHWGESAHWATLWFGVGAVSLLVSGQLTFALGVAIGLLTLRCLQRGWRAAALCSAAACALASPVAAVFLGGVLLSTALSRRRLSGSLVAAGLLAVGMVLALNLLFPDSGQFPFAFSSFIAVPLWCAGALLLTRGMEEEREFRAAVLGYLLASTLVWLAPNQMGGNAIRLGALFGGPLLAAILLTRRTRAPALLVALTLVGSLYWQQVAGVRAVAQSSGDNSAKAAFYDPLRRWLRAHGGDEARIEVPPTANHWEAAYLAPSFALARGWLRQVDTTRNDVFYDEHLSDAAYSRWLEANGVRYVALPRARLDYSARAERRLILAQPPYLRLRWRSPSWTVYEVRDTEPLVLGRGSARARLLHVRPESFAVSVTRPGRFLVRERYTPYWSVSSAAACISRAGDWTELSVSRPARVRVSISFSPNGMLDDVLGRSGEC